MMGVSSFATADEALQKIVESIKTEMAQLTGVMGGFNRESGIATLSGHTNDRAAFNSIVAKIKKLEGVKEVRSSVTFGN